MFGNSKTKTTYDLDGSRTPLWTHWTKGKGEDLIEYVKEKAWIRLSVDVSVSTMIIDRSTQSSP